MDISLSKQQAFEFASFLKITPSKEYINVKAARGANRVKVAFDNATMEYANTFKELSDKDLEELKKAQEELKVYKEGKDGIKPTQEDEKKFIQELQAEFDKTRKVIQDEAIKHEKEQGPTKIAITVNEEDFNFAKGIFETKGMSFQMWQVGEKLDEMATALDNAK